MDTTDARYEVVDPQATGANAIARAFENQVAYCRDNGAEITASVCQALLELLPGERGGTVMLRLRKWAGPPLADALPLRVAGGLHALHLKGNAPELAPIYAGQRISGATDVVADVLERHEAELLPWLDGPPQTNEAGRSSNYAAAMLWLADEGLPLRFALNELGSSAGINLMMGRYFYDLGGTTLGPAGTRMLLKPEWLGNPPPPHDIDIVAARGCDIAPVDLTDPEQALRLRAYIWPEFTERFARMDAAIAAANTIPPEISRQPADAFVDEVLAEPAVSGVTRLIAHSVVWQYVPEVQRKAITERIEIAGAEATATQPLAWVSLEANRDTHRHELTVRYWPGGEKWRKLAVAHPHGAWIEWLGG
ncbi:DUF2332 domain-containing protein [Erythrobacter ani]|uniref:DUF2332 domain-containing protein n=1 Tax=Erythrobacter ani TaxID=2827235 RepID=A0ABS6SI54_9SPHN|nr:DUF2332 domain-containing protein [Erythrobacter ani]MBV7264694.1 DUF2332 domain-containing protein [Erythrobacter ani]